MTVSPEIKGWCPGALNPMMSGDGLVVRVRPFGGQLTRKQARLLAKLADRFGNGVIELSSRGNLQLRGVSMNAHPALLDGLRAGDLLDQNAEAEARRNILVSPFWGAGDETQRLAADLAMALQGATALHIPHKFGFAVDTGARPVLQGASADIRIERDARGTLLLAADGCDRGKPITFATAISEMMQLANWFVKNRGPHKRMKRLLGAWVDLPGGYDVPRQDHRFVPKPGATPQGYMVGLAFGSLDASTLAAVAEHGPLRMTPWRMLMVEKSEALPDIAGVITQGDDPLLRVAACVGLPNCTQSHIETRPLARRLARHLRVGQMLHVSGCTKGCARTNPADLTVTGTPGGLNLIRDGRADAIPEHTNLTPDELIKVI